VLPWSVVVAIHYYEMESRDSVVAVELGLKKPYVEVHLQHPLPMRIDLFSWCAFVDRMSQRWPKTNTPTQKVRRVRESLDEQFGGENKHTKHAQLLSSEC
jgi:hypothetical protein